MGHLKGSMANSEHTFIAIKPDGLQWGLVGERSSSGLNRRDSNTLVWNLCKLQRIFSRSKYYIDLKDCPFFTGLVEYMHSGPVIAIAWEWLNVVKTGWVMLRDANPTGSKPGTMWGDFCIQVGRNIIHGSSSVESTGKISLWFQPEELVDYKSCA